MRLRDPVEHPVGRLRRRWVFDVAVTLFVAAATVPNLFHGSTRPGPLALTVVAALVVPLVVRRVWPVPVFAWMLIVSIPVGLWNAFAVPGFGMLIALYSVAVTQPRRVALTSAALLEVGVLAAVVKVARGEWWYDAIFLSGMVVAAVGLGLYVGTRRAYLLELRDRAERLERERDHQGALAAAAERARIAREMHDIVAHNLAVMIALSDGAVAASARSPERAVDVMRTVSATGRRALADTRRLLGVLRDTDDVDASNGHHPIPDLADLDELIQGVRDAGLTTTLDVRGAALDLPAGVQLTVYRLVQEALTNTLKHGGPGAHATVRLHYLPGEIRVEVDDDGAGSDALTPVGVGSGLAGMHERVHAYGGDITSGPRQLGGWHVAARLRIDDGGAE